MSVVLVVKVSEGLVLAGDSAATLSGKIQGPQGQTAEGILKTFTTARKLLQIGDDLPIGVLTWGLPAVGMRTVESLIREWEYESGWQSSDHFKQAYPKKKASVQDCAKGLLAHLRAVFQEEFGDIDKPGVPTMGMVVAGYSEGEFFPEIWRFLVPEDDHVHDQRPDQEGKPVFGASWFGLTDAIVRLHFGRDDQVPRLISEKFGVPEEEVLEALAPLQFGVPFAQMPLQDAIEYANYVMNVIVGRFRFVVGPELVAGDVDIAVITQGEFEWISRKSWKLG